MGADKSAENTQNLSAQIVSTQAQKFGISIMRSNAQNKLLAIQSHYQSLSKKGRNWGC